MTDMKNNGVILSDLSAASVPCVRVQVTINRNVELAKRKAKATYTWTGQYLNGKPVFRVPARRVISLKSAFAHKKLCDGPKFTLGFVCFFRCLFCYVYPMLCRHPAIRRLLKETGLSFDQVGIEFEDPLPILARELQNRRGQLKYNDPDDKHVIYASPLVDVAANVPTAETTVRSCRLILEKTHLVIRLLSKSAFLRKIAQELADYKEWLIYGLATGTLSDKLADSFELHTPRAICRSRSTTRFSTMPGEVQT